MAQVTKQELKKALEDAMKQLMGANDDPAEILLSRRQTCEMLNEYPEATAEWISNKYGLRVFKVGVGNFFLNTEVGIARRRA